MFYIKCWGRYNDKKEKDKSVGYSYYNLQYNNKQKQLYIVIYKIVLHTDRVSSLFEKCIQCMKGFTKKSAIRVAAFL